MSVRRGNLTSDCKPTQHEPHLCEPMGVKNRHVVYFVDEIVKIRRAGCSHADPEEIQALLVCTSVLLNGFSETKAKGMQRRRGDGMGVLESD